MKTLHTTLSVFLIASLLFSCKDDSKETPNLEEFEVSINVNPEAINVVENGRTETDPSVFTDFSYTLLDSNCNEIDSESQMITGGETFDTIVLPNLAAGTYYYRLGLYGEANIRYDTLGSFTLESDTVLEAYLKNRQMRFKFDEVSDFTNADVNHVTYAINYNIIYWYEQFSCEEIGNWQADDTGGAFIETVYNQEYDTFFEYQSPTEMESVQVKFYNANNTLLKSTIIPLVKSLEIHHSYTFQINLSSIWEAESGSNSIQLNLEEFSWTEETVEVN